MKVPRIAAIAGLALMSGAGAAEAHVFGAGGAGFGQGLAHPFMGLDHLLAMIAVGLWASQIGGRAILALPLAFPAAMAAGALLGGYDVPVPGVELGVAISVVALGAAVAFGLRPPLVASAALVAVFALLHGYAHGKELPEAASPVAYGVGFLIATIILHAIGVGAGLLLQRPFGPIAARVAGSGIAAAGVVLVAQMA